MNRHDQAPKFVANEDVEAGHTIIDPTTGTDKPTAVTGIGPNSRDAEWFYITVTGRRRIGSRQGTGWPIPS